MSEAGLQRFVILRPGAAQDWRFWAFSAPREAWWVAPAVLERWMVHMWGSHCTDPDFDEALAQVPVESTRGSAHLLISFRAGAPHGSEIPARFGVLIPDAEFARFGQDVFCFHAQGGFRWAEGVRAQGPTPPDSANLPPVTISPPDSLPSPTDPSRIASSLEQGRAVVFHSRCSGVRFWGPLRQEWERLSADLRRTTILYTLRFDDTDLGRSVSCQFTKSALADGLAEEIDRWQPPRPSGFLHTADRRQPGSAAPPIRAVETRQEPSPPPGPVPRPGGAWVLWILLACGAAGAGYDVFVVHPAAGEGHELTKGRLESTSQELRQTTEQLGAERKKATELETSRKELEKELERARGELERKLEATKRESERAEARALEASRESERARAEVLEMVKESDRAKESERARAAMLEAARVEIAALEATRSELERTRSNLERQVSVLDQQARTLQGQVTETRAGELRLAQAWLDALSQRAITGVERRALRDRERGALLRLSLHADR